LVKHISLPNSKEYVFIFPYGFKGYWADSNFVNFHKMKFANISEADDATWQQNRAVYFLNNASANEVLKKMSWRQKCLLERIPGSNETYENSDDEACVAFISASNDSDVVSLAEVLLQLARLKVRKLSRC
jgi:hypothetical protein